MVKCEICGHEYKDNVSLGKHVNRTHKVSSKEYYDKYILKGVKPVCEICGAEIKKFHNIGKGYSRVCSRKCVYQLTKKTNLKKYGVENVFASKEIQNKIKKIHLKKCGVEYPAQSKEVRKKVKQTNLERYGVECNLSLDSNKEKQKKTCIKKYGTEYANQNESVKKKMRQSMINKHGAPYTLLSDTLKEKVKQTNLEKYGVINPFQSEKIKEKIKQSNIDKYGTEYSVQAHLTNFDKWLDVEFIKTRFLTEEKYIKMKEMTTFFNNSESSCYNHLTKIGVEYKGRSGTSYYEQEIYDFLKNELGILNIIQNNRNLIKPLELDFYLPDYKLAIEFDGIYWHSEQQGKTKYYHRDKTDACEKKGVQLVHIFENEWIYKQNIIKSILEAKLNMSTKLCYAEQCVIKEITVKESDPFINTNCRQGISPSSLKLGAYYEDELVSVMTFSRPSIAKGSKDNSSITDFELTRFVTKLGYHIPGIASKIFSFFKKNYEWKKLVTYADRRYSSRMAGAFYEPIGFKFVAVTTPCCWYFEPGSIKLIHRFKYKKSELKRLLDTFDPNLTEYQNMVNSGYDRIWDCGNFKFEYSK